MIRLSCLLRPAILLALAAVPISAGCASAPPFAATVSAGEVRAETDRQARDVADLLQHHADAVRALLKDTLDEPVSVWVQERPHVVTLFGPARGVSSFTNRWAGRIHLNADPQAGSADLAHELVHRLLGPSWEPLPDALEEGLADWVSIQVAGDAARPVRFSRVALALAAAGAEHWRVVAGASPIKAGATVGADVHLVDYEPVAPAETFFAGGGRMSAFSGSSGKATLYGLAYVAVSRLVDDHGLDGLHAICVRVVEEEGDPARLFSSLTGLGNDPVPWKREARRLLDGEDAVAFLALDRQTWVHLSTRLCRIGYLGASAGEALAGGRPRLVLVGEEFEVPLERIPGFAEAFVEAWGEPVHGEAGAR